MPEAQQYTITHIELLELLIKRFDVREGRWGLLLGFQIGTGAYGPSPDMQFPGIAIAVQHVGIQRIEPDVATPAGATVLDAAIVNADKQPKRKKK